MVFLLLAVTKPVLACDNEYATAGGCKKSSGSYVCSGSKCADCPYCGEDTDPDWGNKINNPVLPVNSSSLTGTSFINRLLGVLINIGLIAGALLFFFKLTLGAIKWISSEGDKVKLEEARKQITNAFIGLVILFSIFAIIKVIETAFGVSITKLNLPKL